MVIRWAKKVRRGKTNVEKSSVKTFTLKTPKIFHFFLRRCEKISLKIVSLVRFPLGSLLARRLPNPARERSEKSRTYGGSFPHSNWIRRRNFLLLSPCRWPHLWCCFIDVARRKPFRGDFPSSFSSVLSHHPTGRGRFIALVFRAFLLSSRKEISPP